jgi:hypothetical protein
MLRLHGRTFTTSARRIWWDTLGKAFGKLDNKKKTSMPPPEPAGASQQFR